MTDTISITVSTSNQTALQEVGEMFLRLAGQVVAATAAMKELKAVIEDGATDRASFEQFTDAMVKGVATAMDVPAELLTAHIDPGFAERTAHLNTTFTVPAPPVVDDGAASVPAETVAAAFAPPAVPPAPPVLPAAVIPPAPPITQTEQLDSEGLPWDARIHASTKTFRLSDNTWKLARNIEPAKVEAVKAELRAAMSAPGPLASVAAPVPPAPVDQPVIPPAPTAPAAVIPTPPAPAPTGTAPTTFPDFVSRVTAMQNADKIAFTEIVAVCQKHGLANLGLVGSRMDLMPTIFADLEAICNQR
jgi:hypothetical protein